MSKYLNTFQTVADYEAFRSDPERFAVPNVAYILETQSVIVENGEQQPDTPVDPPVDPNPPTPPVEGGIEEGWVTGQFDTTHYTLNYPVVRKRLFANTPFDEVTLNGGVNEMLFGSSSVRTVHFGPDFNPSNLNHLFQESSVESVDPFPAIVTGDMQMYDLFNYATRNLKEVEFLSEQPINYITGFWGSGIRKLVLHCPPGDEFDYNGCPMNWCFVPDESIAEWRERFPGFESEGHQFLPLSLKDEYNAYAEPEFVETAGMLTVTDPFNEIKGKIVQVTGSENGSYTLEEGSESRINFYKWNQEGNFYEMVLEEDGRYITLQRMPGFINTIVTWRVPERQDWEGKDLLDGDGHPTFDAWNIALRWYYNDQRLEIESPLYSSESLTQPIPAPENGPAVTTNFGMTLTEVGLEWNDPDGEFEAAVKDLNDGEFPDPFFPNSGSVTGQLEVFRGDERVALLDGDYISFVYDNGEGKKLVSLDALETVTDNEGNPLEDDEGNLYFDGFQVTVIFNKADGRSVEYVSPKFSLG